MDWKNKVAVSTGATTGMGKQPNINKKENINSAICYEA